MSFPVVLRSCPRSRALTLNFFTSTAAAAAAYTTAVAGREVAIASKGVERSDDNDGREVMYVSSFFRVQKQKCVVRTLFAQV